MLCFDLSVSLKTLKVINCISFQKNNPHSSPDPYSINLEVQAEQDREKAVSMLNNYLSMPQQWNRYSYAINNPLKYTDPTGEVIYLTGSKEDQEKAYARIYNLLGAERAKLVSVSSATLNGEKVTVLSINEEEMNKMDAIGRGDEGMFSVRVSDILGSKEIVEYRLAETFTLRDGTVKTVAEFGGAATLDKDESPTGNIQIFVHPSKAISIAESRLSSIMGRTKSSDGGPLYFSDETIDAHEIGHAHAGVTGQAVNSPAGKARAVEMENTVRERQKGNLGPRRRKID